MIEYTARITSQDTPRVGGRNLIVKNIYDPEPAETTEGYLYRRLILSRKHTFVTGDWYTLSMDVQVPADAKGLEYYNIFDWNGRVNKYGWKGDTRFVIHNGRNHITFKWGDAGNKLSNTGLLLYRGFSYNEKQQEKYPITTSNITLVKGTIGLESYVPAPEDVAESVDKVSTSLVSLASTLLDPNEGDIPQLIRQQDLLANSVKDKADKLELANSVSSLQGEIDKRALGLHLDNAFAYIKNIVKEIDSSRSYTISDSGYISSSVHNSCRNVSKEVTPSSMVCRIPNTQPQIRLTLRSDHDALKRQVDTLTAQLAQLQATTKITPVLNTDTRKRSGSTTLYPQYGDWLLTSDSQEQYISFSGLSAEIGRSIYIQTRRKAYLYANNHSFYGLPGTSSSVAVNQWLANNTTYRFLRADATTWFVTSSASPYPWT